MPEFQGITYSEELDRERLDSQLSRVESLMSDGNFRTLQDIAKAVSGSEAGVSARLRDLRNKLGYVVERKRLGDPSRGLFAYRVVPKDKGFDQSGQRLLGL